LEDPNFYQGFEKLVSKDFDFWEIVESDDNVEEGIDI